MNPGSRRALWKTDRKLRSPKLRREQIEDRFDREFNRDLIGQPECFSLGLSANSSHGWASKLGQAVAPKVDFVANARVLHAVGSTDLGRDRERTRHL